MIRLLLLTLLTATAALAQDAVVVTPSPDGLATAPASDTPVLEGAALVVRTAEGTWHLRALEAGDVPTDELAAVQDAPHLRTVLERLGTVSRSAEVFGRLGQIVDERVLNAVSYDVRARLQTDDLDALVVQMAEADALVDLEVASGPLGTHVEASFRFESAQAWAEWYAQPETRAMLAPLEADDNAQTTLRVR